MVNRGRSLGCESCKQRRVKCDEAKPRCWGCQRRNQQCDYRNLAHVKSSFRDQNHKFNNVIKFNSFRPITISIPPQLQEPETNALSFLFLHYAKSRTRIEPSCGFFDVVLSGYCSQKQDSPLSLAITAVALKIFAVWRDGTVDQRSPLKPYTRAVAAVRNALADSDKRGDPSTILTILVLQFYENLAAVYGLRWATGLHHNGAVSLLPLLESETATPGATAYIKSFVLHSEVSSALRQKRPLQDLVRAYINNKDFVLASNDDPGSTLDLIGTSVADLQADYRRAVTQDDSVYSSYQKIGEILEEAKSLDRKLVAWSLSTPADWQPQIISAGKDLDPSIPTYRSRCEAYPSCQVGLVWNQWRLSRLLVLKIILWSLRTSSGAFGDETGGTDAKISIDYQQQFQRLVHEICDTIPYYLGNRSSVLGFSELSNPAIRFPTYTSENSHRQTSISEAKRHVIAQGPWHAMNALSSLLALISGDEYPDIIYCLESGLYEWICGQFLRIAGLLRLPPTGPFGNAQSDRLFGSPSPEYGNFEAEDLAAGVRKGAVFMTGS